MMAETKLLLFHFSLLCGVMLTCNAATYFVGDNSGWDISTNLDAWAMDKRFSVGDMLVFQYSSPHSLYQVTKPNYQSCNTTKPLQTYSSGNTTVTLSKPGDKFFVCGNKLHCLAGMKLQVHVAGDISPAPSPASQATGIPNASSKKNDPGTAVPASGSSRCNGRRSLAAAAVTLLVLVLTASF